MSCELKQVSKNGWLFHHIIRQKNSPTFIANMFWLQMMRDFFVKYYSTTYNKKSILCICSVWIGKKILVACSISSRWTRLRHAMVYTFYFNSVSIGCFKKNFFLFSNFGLLYCEQYWKIFTHTKNQLKMLKNKYSSRRLKFIVLS